MRFNCSSWFSHWPTVFRWEKLWVTDSGHRHTTVVATVIDSDDFPTHHHHRQKYLIWSGPRPKDYRQAQLYAPTKFMHMGLACLRPCHVKMLPTTILVAILTAWLGFPSWSRFALNFLFLIYENMIYYSNRQCFAILRGRHYSPHHWATLFARFSATNSHGKSLCH